MLSSQLILFEERHLVIKHNRRIYSID